MLSKINRSIGTHAESARAPRIYEIPAEVVTEAIVNAVAHRDYTENGSVQVMLFTDRLEVRNPGRLPPPLTLEKLREAHRSVLGNPLLAESLYLTEYIERMGTGTLEMTCRCLKAGMAEPEFAVTDGFVTTVWRPVLPGRVSGRAAEQVTGQVGARSEPSEVHKPAGLQEGGQEGQVVRTMPGGKGTSQGCKPGCKLNWKPEKRAYCELAFEGTRRARSLRKREATEDEHAASSSVSTVSCVADCWK